MKTFMGAGAARSSCDPGASARFTLTIPGATAFASWMTRHSSPVGDWLPFHSRTTLLFSTKIRKRAPLLRLSMMLTTVVCLLLLANVAESSPCSLAKARRDAWVALKVDALSRRRAPPTRMTMRFRLMAKCSTRLPTRCSSVSFRRRRLQQSLPAPLSSMSRRFHLIATPITSWALSYQISSTSRDQSVCADS